jgi:hypothetical protein
MSFLRLSNRFRLPRGYIYLESCDLAFGGLDLYDDSRHNYDFGNNVHTVRTCERLPRGVVYRMCNLSPTQVSWFVVCTAYAQQTEEERHASQPVLQAVRMT